MSRLSFLKHKIKERKKIYENVTSLAVKEKLRSSLYLNEALDQPHIYRIEIINTLKCNAACQFCSNERLSEDCLTMSDTIIGRVLQQAVIHRTPTINFLGGEAMVDPRFFSLLELFAQAEMHIGIGTNGILLTTQHLHELKRLGVMAFSITIHDAVAEKHDRTVGVPGAFVRIETALREAHGMGFRVGLQTICSPESIASGAFQRILTFAHEKKVPLKINPMMPVGKAARAECLLSAEQTRDLKRLVMSDPLLSTHCIHHCRMERCPMGRTFVGITPAGDMLPCYFMPLSLGNILETGFDDYLSYAQSFPIFQKMGLAEGCCIVAESPKFFYEILKPLYEGEPSLPLDLRKNPAWEQKIRSFHL